MPKHHIGMTLLLICMLCAMFSTTFASTTFASTMTGTYTKQALESLITQPLPDAPVFSTQFSGYIKVFNHTDMFYWFVEAKNDPTNAPVMFWTNGGPGCSGLLGKLTEMGPFQPVPKNDGSGGVKLALRDVTWNESYNIIYVETPDVGFTNVEPGFGPNNDEWTDKEVAIRNADFIKGWFKVFPNFIKNRFYIASESYGGHYIPTLAQELIYRMNNNMFDFELNFVASIVGNPLIYMPASVYGEVFEPVKRNLIPYYGGVGDLYEQKCQPDVTTFPNPTPPRDPICSELERQMHAALRSVDPYALSFPLCVDSNGMLQSSSTGGMGYTAHIRKMRNKAIAANRPNETVLNNNDKYENLNDINTIINNMINTPSNSSDTYFPSYYQPCEEDYATKYLNRKDVQNALHAEAKRTWSMCAPINYSDFDSNANMLPVYVDNANKLKGFKQLIFSGTDDAMCSQQETQMTIFNSWTPKKFWEEETLNGQLIGFKTTFVEPADLTLITIHGAGHMAPSTRPHQTYEVIKRFIDGKL